MIVYAAWALSMPVGLCIVGVVVDGVGVGICGVAGVIVVGVCGVTVVVGVADGVVVHSVVFCR